MLQVRTAFVNSMYYVMKYVICNQNNIIITTITIITTVTKTITKVTKVDYTRE